MSFNGASAGVKTAMKAAPTYIYAKTIGTKTADEHKIGFYLDYSELAAAR